MKLPIPFSIALAALSALFLSGCATEPNLYTGKTGYYGYTWEQEQKLGAQSDEEIVKQMGIYPDDSLSAYIDSIGNDLLEHTAIRSQDAPELYRNSEFTFRLLDSPVVNAFALPGGFVYVTRGLLAHLENEAQLAVVIGHEITHVEARHASRQALKQQLGQIGLLAGAVIGEQVAENKELARQMVSLSGDLFQLVTLKYGRDAERESDLHGVEYAAKAGYDASEGSAFFRSLDRISEKSGQSIPSWMSTHPDPGEREKTITELATNWKGATPGEPVVGRERFLSQIDGLIVGENPRNGFTQDGYFYHPDLKLQFQVPKSWAFQNETSAVYFLSPDKTAMLTFSATPEPSPLQAAQTLRSKFSLETTYVQDSQINGLPAYTIVGQVSNQSGTLGVSATYVQLDSQVFAFIGYGNSIGFTTHLPTFRTVTSSFEQLTAPQILSIQPPRISVTQAPRSATLKELLPDRLPPGTDAQDWAIMNQMNLDDRIERGTLIKLPSTQ